MVEQKEGPMPFQDRWDAGRQLAALLADYRGRDAVVLGLPRGGVVTAQPVAEGLGAPLDVLVARKLGAPGNEEFAIGAVTARGTRVLYEAVLRRMLLPPGYLEAETERQRRLAETRERTLRGLRPAEPLAGRVVILVDDGIATGMTMRAAIADAQAQRPARLVVAAPVIAPDTYRTLLALVDEVVAVEVPDDFMAVGQFYRDFAQTTDEDVARLLAPRVT
ncbi:MAG: phosphoribosyltransferase [Candidatus Sericytochromatia bacterium]